MITLTEIETLLITCLPALTSLIGVITAVVSIINKLNTLKDNELIKTERDELKKANEKLISECRAIKKQTSLLIQNLSKINYNDMGEVKDDKDLQV